MLVAHLTSRWRLHLAILVRLLASHHIRVVTLSRRLDWSLLGLLCVLVNLRMLVHGRRLRVLGSHRRGRDHQPVGWSLVERQVSHLRLHVLDRLRHRVAVGSPSGSWELGSRSDLQGRLRATAID